MKIRERLIKCGDFSIEREHLTIDTVYALKSYLILRKAGMNILGGRILFYYLEEGTSPEITQKLKDLEEKNRDKLCLVYQYETYPAGLGIFMQGDLMYKVMDTGVNIKDAKEMTPLEAVKLLESHLHFTLEAEDVEDIDRILAEKASAAPDRRKKKSVVPPERREESVIAEPQAEKTEKEYVAEKTDEKTWEEEPREKATVPERFIRKRSHTPEESKKPDPDEENRKEMNSEIIIPGDDEASYFDNEDDRREYLEYALGAESGAAAEDPEEAEYLDAISGDRELLRESGMIDDEQEAGQDTDDEIFILDIGYD